MKEHTLQDLETLIQCLLEDEEECGLPDHELELLRELQEERDRRKKLSI